MTRGDRDGWTGASEASEEMIHTMSALWTVDMIATCPNLNVSCGSQ